MGGSLSSFSTTVGYFNRIKTELHDDPMGNAASSVQATAVAPEPQTQTDADGNVKNECKEAAAALENTKEVQRLGLHKTVDIDVTGVLRDSDNSDVGNSLLQSEPPASANHCVDVINAHTFVSPPLNAQQGDVHTNPSVNVSALVDVDSLNIVAPFYTSLTYVSGFYDDEKLIAQQYVLLRAEYDERARDETETDPVALHHLKQIADALLTTRTAAELRAILARPIILSGGGNKLYLFDTLEKPYHWASYAKDQTLDVFRGSQYLIVTQGRSPTIQEVLQGCHSGREDDVFYILRAPMPDCTPVLEIRPSDCSACLNYRTTLTSTSS